MKIGTADVRILDGAVCWVGRLAVDADGSPHAYHPDSKRGLDRLDNAGKPGAWYGIAAAPDGNPIVQGPNDPAPGFYVSTTALIDPAYPSGDPRRYVDSEQVPYLSVPPELIHGMGVRKGDLAAVYYKGTICFAVVADVGPHGEIGEGSVALAQALGIPSSARDGGCSGGVRFAVFTGSSQGWPRSNGSISGDGSVILEHWGGVGRLSALS
jgi:hypothetical protein